MERTDRCVERLRSQNTKWISGVDLPLIVPSALMDNSCETSADSFFPLKLKHTGVASSRLGSRLVSAKQRRWDDSYLQPSLFDRHYCLTQCFPKSHRSDRITPKFAAPTACLFNTNRDFFIIFLQICVCPLSLHFPSFPFSILASLELQTVHSRSRTVVLVYCFVCWLRAAFEAGKLEYDAPWENGEHSYNLKYFFFMGLRLLFWWQIEMVWLQGRWQRWCNLHFKSFFSPSLCVWKASNCKEVEK